MFSPDLSDILHENYPLSRQPLASTHIKPYYYTVFFAKKQVFFHFFIHDFKKILHIF